MHSVVPDVFFDAAIAFHDRPRLPVVVGIVNDDFGDQSIAILFQAVAFHQVQVGCVRKALWAKESAVLHANSVHDQGVTVPPTDAVADRCRKGVFRGEAVHP